MTGDDRLRAELEALERSAPTDLPPRPPLPQRRRGTRLWLPATLTLGVGLVLGILGTQWLEAIRPSASTGPTGSGNPSPSATPSTSPEAVDLHWSVEAFLPETGAQPGAIGRVGDRLIVTGRDRDGSAAWYSDDGGADWQRASIVGGDDEGRPVALGAVAGGADRLLSLGWVTVGANDADRRSVLWASTDAGMTWERIADDAVPLRLHDLTSGGPGFVAVGNANPSNSGGPDLEPPHAAVWVSADGREWERLPDEAAFQLSRVNAITGRAGTLVAVGSVRVGEEDVPAIWRSSDGRQWSRAQLSASPGAIESIAAGPNGFVAVGSSSEDGQRAMAWLSADGETWAALTLDEAGGGVATGVAVNALGFVAIGTSTQSVDAPRFVWFVPAGGVASRQDATAEVSDVVGTADLFIGVGGCGPLADCYSHSLVIGRPVTAAQPDASPAPSSDLVGTLHGDRDLEVGCAWLTDSTGKQWEILWPEGYRIAFPAGRDPVLIGHDGEVVARAGDVIAVEGAPPSGLGSHCMVGELFEATRVIVQAQGAGP